MMQLSYWQGRNGDLDIERRLPDTVGAEEGGSHWESNIEIYTVPYVKY